jgi:hypothetical protein
MREKHFLTVDTETTGLGRRAFVFDLGYVIATRKAVKLERSFLIREVITNPRIMLGAIFNDDWRAMFGGKIFRHYIPAINAGEEKVVSWHHAIETLREDMRTYNVDVLAAYNLDFDKRALGHTQHFVCNGGKVLDYRPDLLCLWDFSCSTVCNTPLYHDVARTIGGDWVTDADNVRTTAEKVYAYLTGQHDFIESHTALHDAQIETVILQRLLAKKKPIPYNNPDLAHPWRRAQRIRGRLFD